MDCGHFERWLDDGQPQAAAAGAHAHADSCAHCAAALASARALDAALERYAATAPAGFTARVMERVPRARAGRPLAWVEPDALPWWVRAAAEPAAALSLALAALVLWKYATLARFAAAAFETLASPAVAGFLRQVASPRLTLDLSRFSDPFVLAGLALAGLPLAWWAGIAVYHWSGDPRTLRSARR